MVRASAKSKVRMSVWTALFRPVERRLIGVRVMAKSRAWDGSRGLAIALEPGVVDVGAVEITDIHVFAQWHTLVNVRNNLKQFPNRHFHEGASHKRTDGKPSNQGSFVMIFPRVLYIGFEAGRRQGSPMVRCLTVFTQHQRR
jgi:hypothetical protein